MKPLNYLFVLFSLITSVGAYAEDYVECRIERTSFRQFCTINETPIEEQFTVPRFVAVTSGIELDLLPVIETAKIVLNDLNGNGELPLALSSLAPVLKADIEYTYSLDCQRSSLWTDRIFLAVKDPLVNDSLALQQVWFGLNSYTIDLDRHKSDYFSPWTVETVGSNLNVLSKYGLKNTTADPRRPAKQRIPRSCRMDVKSLYLSFRDLQMTFDLNALHVQSSTTIAVMTRAAVLHATLVDGQRGSICSVYKLGDRLKTIEFAFDWDDLSYDAQDLLVDGVNDAVALGAIDPASISNGDVWAYFKSGFQSLGDSLCTSTPSWLYDVSTDPFVHNGTVVNYQGYHNAMEYFRAKQNIYQLLRAGFAVSTIAQKVIDDYDQQEWLTNSTILEQL